MTNDFIKDSVKNIKRNKKNITLISILILLFFVLFFDIIFMKNIYTYIDSYINKNIDFRTFFANNIDTEENSEEAIEKIKKLNHVVDVYDSKYFSYNLDTDINKNDLSGIVTLYRGSKNTTPKSIIGKQINELKSGEMICPYNFYPDSGAPNLKIDDKKIITPDQIMNKDFTVFYVRFVKTGKIVNGYPEEEKEILSKKFKIVGFYDNQPIMKENNDCYGLEEDIKLFVDTLYSPYKLEDNLNLYSLHVVVDKKEHITDVKNEIEKMGFEVSEEEIASIVKPVFKIIISVAISLFIIITCAIIFLLYSYLRKKIKSESKYLGILRACGYTQKQILVKELIENITILSISFLISSFIFSISFLILENSVPLFRSIAYIGFKIKNNLFILLAIFIVILIISTLISIKTIRKNTNYPISKLLGDE